MEEVDPLQREHSLSVLLPGGLERSATVHGSKPVMDLLVTLCASYHLNPSDYTVEVLSPNKNNIAFKPNSPIGSLEAEKIVLKPRAGEEKIRTPYMPEATVRLLINYNKSHKAVVRVSPRVPLESLLPVVCDKCEFRLESTELLRDSGSREALDLTKTLNEHGLRELYARDTAAKERGGLQHLFAAAGITPTKVSSSSSLQDLTKKEKKKSENKGFLSLFRKHKKKSESTHALSAPSSPGSVKWRPSSVSAQDVALCSARDQPKKRRAPQPPIGGRHSFPTNLSSCHLPAPQAPEEKTLRSTKRRAPPPPPPPGNHCQEAHADSVKDRLNDPEEEGESVCPDCGEEPPPSPSTALPPCPAPLQGPDPQRPAVQGKDPPDARAALAKVLTSSLSTGALLRRLRNTNPFLKVDDDDASSSNGPGVEIKSVLNSNLPTESELEDQASKPGLTTFKVVPSRRQSGVEQTQEKADAETEVERVFPETDQSVSGGGSPGQSESDSPIPRSDEGEAARHDNESVGTPKQDDASPGDDVKEETKSTGSRSPDQSGSGSHTPSPDEGGTFLDPLQLDDENKDEETTGTETHADLRPDGDLEGDMEEIEAETEIQEQVITDTDQSQEGESALDQSGSGSPLPHPDEGDGTLFSLDNESKGEEAVETVQQEDVGPGDDLKEEVMSVQSLPPDQSESGSPLPHPDDRETTPCPPERDSQSNDDETEADDARPGDDLKEEVESAQSHESVATDLYLAEEEAVKERPVDLDTSDSRTCDRAAQDDDDDLFPPPPPPVSFNDYLEETNSDSGPSVANGCTGPSSEVPRHGPPPVGAEKATSAPSRFAQAVAMAVQRSKLHNTGKAISALLHQES